MQEYDYIYLAKMKQPRASLKPVESIPAESAPVIKKHSWFKRILMAVFSSSDLDLETFEALEAKRTRHQIQQNRISRYF